MEAIRLENASFWYPESEKSSISDINLSIEKGEFVLIVGPSGCGKSTLIRLINRVIPDFYGGKIKGNVYLNGKNIYSMDKKDIVQSVGMVYQHPERQLVLQDVEREIAFGLENLNFDVNTMKRNVAEVMSLLSLVSIRDKQTTEISGGQKQRVAIASVVSMNPEIILFDEPISQLDPIAGEEVLNSIKKLNRDTGKTVVLIEQRLDKCFDMVDRIIFMEEGKIIGEGSPHNIPNFINKRYHLPCISYIFKTSGYDKVLPVNIKEGRKAIENLDFKLELERNINRNDCVLQVKGLNFEYEKGARTLKNINFKLNKGEILSVMGENGAGKSTLFKIIAGLNDKYTGKVSIQNHNSKKMNTNERIKKIGYLSQNPNDYFGRDTVFEEVAYTLRNINEFDENKVEKILEWLKIRHLKDRNPRDLSGGEKQRVAIACTLITDPGILILDEPTRGMDWNAKDNLGKIIEGLANKGKSIIIITHDSDFAADYSNNIMLMFGGEIIANGNVEDILYDSIYYSPQVAKIFKDKCKVVKSEDAIRLLRVI